MKSSSIIRAIIANLHGGENVGQQKLDAIAKVPQSDFTRAVLIIGYTYTFGYSKAAKYVSSKPLELSDKEIRDLGDDLLFVALLFDTIYSMRQKRFTAEKFIYYSTILKDRLNAHLFYFGLVDLYADEFLDDSSALKKQIEKYLKDARKQIADFLTDGAIPKELPIRIRTFLQYAISEILRRLKRHHKSVKILSELPLIKLDGNGLNLYEIFYESAVAAIERYTLSGKYSEAIELGDRVTEHVRKYKQREAEVEAFKTRILNGNSNDRSSSVPFLYYYALSKIRGGSSANDVMYGLKLLSSLRNDSKDKLPNFKYKKTLVYELCLDFMLMGYPEVVSQLVDSSHIRLVRIPRLRSSLPWRLF